MGRKVVSQTAPLVVHGAIPVKKSVDKTLKPGEKVVDDPGEPAMTTSVTRDVYAADGKLLHHDVFYSSYRSSPELVRLGPKPKKAKQPKPQQPKQPKQPQATPVATTLPAPTTTQPAQTTTQPAP
jgi:hypothetical protein